MIDPRKGHANVQRLVASLQRSRSRLWATDFRKDEGVSHRQEIDVVKDAVSIPCVSMHYLLKRSIERGAEQYSPGKEASEMMKEAVVGGPSIVFTRFHEVEVAPVRRAAPL